MKWLKLALRDPELKKILTNVEAAIQTAGTDFKNARGWLKNGSNPDEDVSMRAKMEVDLNAARTKLKENLMKIADKIEVK